MTAAPNTTQMRPPMRSAERVLIETMTASASRSGLRNADRIRRDLRLAALVQAPCGALYRRHGYLQRFLAISRRRDRAVRGRVLLQGLRLHDDVLPHRVERLQHGGGNVPADEDAEVICIRLVTLDRRCDRRDRAETFEFERTVGEH